MDLKPVINLNTRDIAANRQRLQDISTALQKLNHFSEEMIEWKGGVSTELRWFRYLLGAILLALLGQYFV